MRQLTLLGLVFLILAVSSEGYARLPTPYLSPEELTRQSSAVVVGRVVGTAMADERAVGTWVTLDIQEVLSGQMPTGTVRILVFYTLEPHVIIPLPAAGELPEGRRLMRPGEPDQWLKQLHPKVGEVLEPRELWFFEWGALVDAKVTELSQPQIWVLTRHNPYSGKQDMPALGISLAQHVQPLSARRYFETRVAKGG
jgi:hypothetical protein